MVSRCTWQDCNEVATSPQIGNTGNQWANLCDAHAKELDDNLLDVKGVLRCWIRAQGGAKAMTQKAREDGTVDRTAKLAGRLSKYAKRTA